MLFAAARWYVSSPVDRGVLQGRTPVPQPGQQLGTGAAHVPCWPVILQLPGPGLGVPSQSTLLQQTRQRRGAGACQATLLLQPGQPPGALCGWWTLLLQPGQAHGALADMWMLQPMGKPMGSRCAVFASSVAAADWCTRTDVHCVGSPIFSSVSGQCFWTLLLACAPGQAAIR